MSKVAAVHELYAMAEELGIQDDVAEYVSGIEELTYQLAQTIAVNMEDAMLVSPPYLDIDGLYASFQSTSDKDAELFETLNIDPEGEL